MGYDGINHAISPQPDHPPVRLHYKGTEMQAQNPQIKTRAPGRPGRPVGSRNTSPKGMVTVQGLSEMLGLSAATIRRYSSASPWRLPPRAIWPGKMLWSISVVDAWLAQRTTEMPAASPMMDMATAAADPVPVKTKDCGCPCNSEK